MRDLCGVRMQNSLPSGSTSTVHGTSPCPMSACLAPSPVRGRPPPPDHLTRGRCGGGSWSPWRHCLSRSRSPDTVPDPFRWSPRRRSHTECRTPAPRPTSVRAEMDRGHQQRAGRSELPQARVSFGRSPLYNPALTGRRSSSPEGPHTKSGMSGSFDGCQQCRIGRARQGRWRRRRSWSDVSGVDRVLNRGQPEWVRRRRGRRL